MTISAPKGHTPRRFRAALAGVAVALGWAACSADRELPDSVTIARGTVVRTAVATGFVEPERETQVNTQLAGFVRKLHVKLGQKVKAGDPLAEVWPDLTERDLLGAERAVQAAREGEEAAEEFVQGSHALAWVMRALQGGNNITRMRTAAERGRRTAEETMRLLQEGRVEIDGRTIDFVIRAPVAGHVLQLVREGDPVTPASTYGIGTVVAVLGDLDKPVFRGTIDEIDVGRLRESMAARIRLGSLQDVELAGKIVEIGLRAHRQDSSATFDVRIALENTGEIALRSGYSAVAEIDLARATDVLIVPERCLRWDGGAASVLVTGSNGALIERPVEIGTADGIQAEVVSGLTEGDRVFERPGALR